FVYCLLCVNWNLFISTCFPYTTLFRSKEGIIVKLCNMGLGYIGLPTSIMFASHGVDVVGVDVKEEVVESLNNGKIHIEEPGLQEDRKSTRLNSSHVKISYAVFCLKKKT